MAVKHKKRIHTSEMLDLLEKWSHEAGRNLTRDTVYSSYRDITDWMVDGSFCIAVHIPQGFCALRAYVVVQEALPDALVAQWKLRLVSLPSERTP